VAELDDQPGEVGLPGGDAGVGERFVEPDLLGRHRLDLDHRAGPGRADDAGDELVGFGRVAGPADGAAARADPFFELHQVAVEVGQDVVFDGRAGGA
jgi:hypothetical protein